MFSQLRSATGGLDFGRVLKMNDISIRTQEHLKKTYLALCAGVSVAAAGSYIHMLYNLGGMMSGIGCFLLLGMLHSSRSNNSYDSAEFQKRLGYYLGFCLLKGISIGGLIENALFIDPAIVLVSFIGTMVVFGCFSLAALLAKRRSYMYIAGFLGSAMTLFFWMNLANLYFRSAAAYNVQIYGGLLVFSGYVVVDTQMIVERSESGSKDFLWAASELFTDFVALFVRILILVMRNSNQRRRREEKNRNYRR